VAWLAAVNRFRDELWENAPAVRGGIICFEKVVQSLDNVD